MIDLLKFIFNKKILNKIVTKLQLIMYLNFAINLIGILSSRAKLSKSKTIYIEFGSAIYSIKKIGAPS